ncbi:MAG: hypothetical protein VX527_09265 [Planctomycetota bacterium]|nr:hypothetical protein [Planctomycetota bacterium]
MKLLKTFVVVSSAALVMMLAGCDRVGVSNTELIGNWVHIEPREDLTNPPVYVRYYELSENGILKRTTWSLKKASDYSTTLSKQALDALSTSRLHRSMFIETGSWSWDAGLFTVDLRSRHFGSFVRTQYKIVRHKTNDSKKSTIWLLLADHNKAIENGIIWTERTIADKSKPDIESHLPADKK